jgi:hypothetical protein
MAGELEDRVTDFSIGTSQMWGEAFTLTEHDVDFINNLLLEEGAPMSSERLASALIRERLQSDAKRRARLKPEDTIYLPRNQYRVGQELVFPVMGFDHGTVISVRAGENPEFAPFDVIRVRGEGREREFAARLENHRLNTLSLEAMMGEGEQTPEKILDDNGKFILPALESRLSKTSDIVKIAGAWFPRALLVEISHGHLNLAEAVLDVSGGGPLPTSALLEHIELPNNIDPRLAAFSLEYVLYQDERFEEVGPAGEMAWYLKRLEPPEVMFPPRRLTLDPLKPSIRPLSAQLQNLERELEDEWSPAEGKGEDRSESSLILTFPHWRVGTLPLNARLAKIFPHAHQATRIRFEFVDADDGHRFPGWVVTPFRYVFGLAEWYEQKGLLPGGVLRIRKAENPGEIILEAATRRPAREWIRTATASANNRLVFTMQKQAVAVEYDELSVIAVRDLHDVDELWLRISEQKTPLDDLVADVFRELAKLNPQSTVHARTLFSAVNIIRRLTPGAVFAELTDRAYYSHVGDLYYRFDEAKWTEKK